MNEKLEKTKSEKQEGNQKRTILLKNFQTEMKNQNQENKANYKKNQKKNVKIKKIESENSEQKTQIEIF